MSNLAKTPTTGIQQIDATIRVVTDPQTSIEDKAAATALLHAAQLIINRVTRPVKNELIAYMEREHIRRLGPLSVGSSPIDPVYVCNAEGNWGDSGTQDALEGLRADPDYSEYVRVIPAHLEIDAARLGADTHAGIPQARQLFEQLKEHGWRREAGRRLSLKVAEPTRREKEAA